MGRSSVEARVAAEIITGKYGYHLPFYRQQDWFAGSGWCPTRSTLLNILVAAEFVLRLLADYRRRLMMTKDVIGCDETRATLITPTTVRQHNDGVNVDARPCCSSICDTDKQKESSGDSPDDSWRRVRGLATLLCFGSYQGVICLVENSWSQPVRTGLVGSKTLPLNWGIFYESTGETLGRIGR